MFKVSNETLGITEDNSNKNEALAYVFSCKFCEILKKTFFTGHFQVTASDIGMQVVVIYNLNLSSQFVAMNFTLFCEFSCCSRPQWRLNFYIDLFFGSHIF